MEFAVFLQGAVIGFLVAAPVGPVAVLCIQRTLADGRLAGYATGIGAALADTAFGALAIFSVAYVLSFLEDNEDLVRLVGGIVLIGLGVRTIWDRHIQERRQEARSPISHATLAQALVSSFMVTILNPITILAFLSIFAAAGISVSTEGVVDSWVVIVGVLAGALTWWWTLSSIASIFRNRFTDSAMRWLNMLSGVLIASFGLWALASLVWPEIDYP